MPTLSDCALCLTSPGVYTKKYLRTLCCCGCELGVHTLAHPHGFTGGTPSCKGFQARAAVPASPVRADEQLALPGVSHA